VLDINPILLLITLVVFIALVYYLNKKLYVPLIDYMNKRDEGLQRDRESANQNSADIDSLHQEAEAILASARKEATSNKESVINEAKAIIEKTLREKREELEKKYVEFEKSLLTDREALKSQLLGNSTTIQSALKEKFATI